MSFVSPKSGSTVPNPVLFEIAARGVDELEIFADETYSLGPAWDPAACSTLLYRFAGTGFARQFHVVARLGGVEVARQDLTITVQPDPCEDLFFVAKFDAQNSDPTGTLDLVGIREETLAIIKQQFSDLQACGAQVTLGGLLSLLYFEGGFRTAAYNTRCEENSYNRTATNCDTDPEALYSYQFGLGAIHTSNFHPCKGGGWTQKMRQDLLAAAGKAGFSTDPALVTPDLASRFSQVCPAATPSAVDYYLLGAHDVFGIPRDGSGNHLLGYGTFPLFTPAVSVVLGVAELVASCASIGSDRDAIAAFSGADTSYSTTAKQDTILALYQTFAATSCQ